MKALVLAAGYGTRLGSLTRDRPKPLLPVAGRPLLDYLADQIQATGAVDHLYVVSNRRYVETFRSWAEKVRRRSPSLPSGPARGDDGSDTKARPSGPRLPVTVLDDGTTSDEARLGAVGDLAFSLREAEIEDDLLVMAGDSLFDFPLAKLVVRFRNRPDAVAVVAATQPDDPDRLRRGGVLSFDEAGRILRFEEKPAEPHSRWGALPLYLFRRSALSLVFDYLEGERDPDAPGHLLEWLVRRHPVYVHLPKGRRHDIGTPASYRETDRVFRRRLPENPS